MKKQILLASAILASSLLLAGCRDTAMVRAAGNVTTYLVLTQVGLYEGAKGEDVAEKFLENTITYEAEAGSALPGSDKITATSGATFDGWVAYEGTGALTKYTTVPNENGKVLYAYFTGGDGTPIPPEPEVTTHTIHVPAMFSNYYVWNGDSKMADWPGKALTNEDATWKVATFNVGSYVNIIFNGTNGQTIDLEIPAEGEWWMQVGTVKDGDNYAARFVSKKPESTTYENTVVGREYIINVPEQYTHYYCWGAYATAAWPGDALVNHQAKFTAGASGKVNIIFNNGSDAVKTGDLELPAEAGTYTFNGTSFVAA